MTVKRPPIENTRREGESMLANIVRWCVSWWLCYTGLAASSAFFTGFRVELVLWCMLLAVFPATLVYRAWTRRKAQRAVVGNEAVDACDYALELERRAKALSERLDRDKGLISTYPPIEMWIEYKALRELIESGKGNNK